MAEKENKERSVFYSMGFDKEDSLKSITFCEAGEIIELEKVKMNITINENNNFILELNFPAETDEAWISSSFTEKKDILKLSLKTDYVEYNLSIIFFQMITSFGVSHVLKFIIMDLKIKSLLIEETKEEEIVYQYYYRFKGCNNPQHFDWTDKNIIYTEKSSINNLFYMNEKDGDRDITRSIEAIYTKSIVLNEKKFLLFFNPKKLTNPRMASLIIKTKENNVKKELKIIEILLGMMFNVFMEPYNFCKEYHYTLNESFYRRWITNNYDTMQMQQKLRGNYIAEGLEGNDFNTMLHNLFKTDEKIIASIKNFTTASKMGEYASELFILYEISSDLFSLLFEVSNFETKETVKQIVKKINEIFNENEKEIIKKHYGGNIEQTFSDFIQQTFSDLKKIRNNYAHNYLHVGKNEYLEEEKKERKKLEHPHFTHFGLEGSTIYFVGIDYLKNITYMVLFKYLHKEINIDWDQFLNRNRRSYTHFNKEPIDE